MTLVYCDATQVYGLYMFFVVLIKTFLKKKEKGN